MANLNTRRVNVAFAKNPQLNITIADCTKDGFRLTPAGQPSKPIELGTKIIAALANYVMYTVTVTLSKTEAKSFEFWQQMQLDCDIGNFEVTDSSNLYTPIRFKNGMITSLPDFNNPADAANADFTISITAQIDTNTGA